MQVANEFSDEIKGQFKESIKATACSLLRNLTNELPEGKARELLERSTDDFARSDIDIGNLDLMAVKSQEYVLDKTFDYAEQSANDVIKDALRKMPAGDGKAALQDFLSPANISEAMQFIRQGKSSEEIGYFLLDKGKSATEKYVTKQLQTGLSMAVDKAFAQMRDGRHGNTRYNSHLTKLHERIDNELAGNISGNVADLFTGRKDITTASRDIVLDTGKSIIEQEIREQTGTLVKKGVDQMTSPLIQRGRGKKQFNDHVRGGRDILSDELGTRATENVLAVVSGEKSVSQAVQDTAVDTGTATVKRFAKEEGAKFIAECCQSLAAQAEKKITNELVRTTTASALRKLGNTNAVVQVVGAAYDFGKSIIRYMNGEITKAELMRELGQKCVNVVVGSTFAVVFEASISALALSVPALATVACGLVGALASNLLYGSVLSVFEEADRAKAEYEQGHAMCEESIRIMREQRQRFEETAERLLNRRRETFARSFDLMEKSMAAKDVDIYVGSLNAIAREFGKDLGEEFQSMEKFDEFMLDDDKDFVL